MKRLPLQHEDKLINKAAMKKVILSLVLAVVSVAGYAQTEEDNQTATSKLTKEQKEARIQEIRKAYADAKAKVAKNGKNGQSPRDLWIECNDVIDKEADVTSWEGISVYFDSEVEGEKDVNRPYFIVENATAHQHLLYREMLINPTDSTLMFCYRRGETDAGFVVESRYYYDTEGLLVEAKHSTHNTWSTPEGEQEVARKYIGLFKTMTQGVLITRDGTMADAPSGPKSAARQSAQRTKEQQMTYIRNQYSWAKKKVAQEAHEYQKRNVRLVLHDQGLQWPPQTTELQFYFDTRVVELPDQRRHDNYCYFISEHRQRMGFDSYEEYLFDTYSQDLIFYYCKCAEEGEQWEWRRYYDQQGNCIEQKGNSADDVPLDKNDARNMLGLFYKVLTE